MKQVNNLTSCQTCIYRGVIFGSLNPEELTQVTASRRELAFAKGEVLFRQGEPVREFLYLKTGLVKLYRTDARSDQIIRIAEPGDFVSLLSIFSESNYRYSIMALEDTVVCTVDIDVFKNIVKNNSGFSMDVLHKMSELYDKIIEAKFNLSRKHLRGRIAYILLMFSEKIYKTEEFTLPISRKEISQLIDMTTENVIRILSEFNTDDLIELKGKQVKIIDGGKLKMIADLG